MDSKTLIRCGLAWFVLLLFAIDGSGLIRAAENQQPARETFEKELAEELSVELEPTPYPIVEKRPAWFVEDQAFSDEVGLLDVMTHRSCTNFDQAKQELWDSCIKAVAPIVDRWYGAGSAREIGLTPARVKEFLIHDNLVVFERLKLDEPADEEVADCFHGYARLELNQDFRKFAEARLRKAQTRNRIMGAGLLGGTIVSLLVVALGYLKLETITRGFYSRRLQTLALLLVVGLISTAVFCFQLFAA